jgi:hypothetical protein
MPAREVVVDAVVEPDEVADEASLVGTVDRLAEHAVHPARSTTSAASTLRHPAVTTGA